MPDFEPLENVAPEELVAAFEAASLPLAIWQQHETHLRVALWYLLTLPADRAAERICLGIQRYNAAQGIRQTPTGGYHETLTRAFIHLIRCRLTPAARQRPFAELATELREVLGSRRAVLAFYSQERLASPEARMGWIEPDLAPLPTLPLD